jgi:hypothetical protein
MLIYCIPYPCLARKFRSEEPDRIRNDQDDEIYVTVMLTNIRTSRLNFFFFFFT